MSLFRLYVECPRCGKASEVTAPDPETTVRCGDCLMDRVEVVTMKTKKAEPIKSDGRSP